MKLPGLRRTQVEWVDLYTRQTLLALLWLTVLVLLIGALPVARANAAAMTALVVIAVAVLAVGTWVQREVADAWLAGGPTPVRRVLAMLVVAGCGVGLAATLPEDPRMAGLAMVWSGLVWSLSGLRDRRHLVALAIVLTAGAFVALGDVGSSIGTLLAAVFIGLTVHLSLWMLDVVRRLDRARDAEAALAVAEERLRFSRDVHDVLGRHLSTIAVRSELAAALARRGDETAPEMMLEVRATAHDALREARELARGYRTSNLDQELAGARSLLGAAGIDTLVDVGGLPTGWHEPAAWVVREAVTNVLRHSAATTVEITWHEGVLSVGNDGGLEPTEGAGGSGVGDGAANGADNGVGILGLTERLAALGAVVSTTMRGGRWTLSVTMPDDATGRSDEPRPTGEEHP